MPQYCAVPDCGKQLPYRNPHRAAAYNNAVRTLQDGSGQKAHYKCIKRMQRTTVAQPQDSPSVPPAVPVAVTVAVAAAVPAAVEPSYTTPLLHLAAAAAVAEAIATAAVAAELKSTSPAEQLFSLPTAAVEVKSTSDKVEPTPVAHRDSSSTPMEVDSTSPLAVRPLLTMTAAPSTAVRPCRCEAPQPPLSLAIREPCFISGESATVLFVNLPPQLSFVVKCMFTRVSLRAEQSAFQKLLERGRADALGPLNHMRQLISMAELTAAQMIRVRCVLKEQSRVDRIRSKVRECRQQQSPAAAAAVDQWTADELINHVVDRRLCFRWYEHTLSDSVRNARVDVVHYVRQLLGLRSIHTHPPTAVDCQQMTVRLLRWICICIDAVLRHHHVSFLLGDIKPQNLFLQKEYDAFNKQWSLRPVLGDYGFARDVRGASRSVSRSPPESGATAAAAAAAAAVPVAPHPASCNMADIDVGFEVVATYVHGTISYASPEMRDHSRARHYTAASDAYSLAASLVDVLAGETLGDHHRCSREEAIDRFLNCGRWKKGEPDCNPAAAGEQLRLMLAASAAARRRSGTHRGAAQAPLPERSWLPSDLLHLLKRMLNRDPLQRPSLADAAAESKRLLTSAETI